MALNLENPPNIVPGTNESIDYQGIGKSMFKKDKYLFIGCPETDRTKSGQSKENDVGAVIIYEYSNDDGQYHLSSSLGYGPVIVGSDANQKFGTSLTGFNQEILVSSERNSLPLVLPLTLSSSIQMEQDLIYQNQIIKQGNISVENGRLQMNGPAEFYQNKIYFMDTPYAVGQGHEYISDNRKTNLGFDETEKMNKLLTRVNVRNDRTEFINLPVRYGNQNVSSYPQENSQVLYEGQSEFVGDLIFHGDIIACSIVPGLKHNLGSNEVPFDNVYIRQANFNTFGAETFTVSGERGAIQNDDGSDFIAKHYYFPFEEQDGKTQYRMSSYGPLFIGSDANDISSLMNDTMLQVQGKATFHQIQTNKFKVHDFITFSSQSTNDEPGDEGDRVVIKESSILIQKNGTTTTILDTNQIQSQSIRTNNNRFVFSTDARIDGDILLENGNIIETKKYQYKSSGKPSRECIREFTLSTEATTFNAFHKAHSYENTNVSNATSFTVSRPMKLDAIQIQSEHLHLNTNIDWGHNVSVLSSEFTNINDYKILKGSQDRKKPRPPFYCARLIEINRDTLNTTTHYLQNKTSFIGTEEELVTYQTEATFMDNNETEFIYSKQFGAIEANEVEPDILNNSAILIKNQYNVDVSLGGYPTLHPITTLINGVQFSQVESLYMSNAFSHSYGNNEFKLGQFNQYISDMGGTDYPLFHYVSNETASQVILSATDPGDFIQSVDYQFPEMNRIYKNVALHKNLLHFNGAIANNNGTKLDMVPLGGILFKDIATLNETFLYASDINYQSKFFYGQSDPSLEQPMLSRFGYHYTRSADNRFITVTAPGDTNQMAEDAFTNDVSQIASNVQSITRTVARSMFVGDMNQDITNWSPGSVYIYEASDTSLGLSFSLKQHIFNPLPHNSSYLYCSNGTAKISGVTLSSDGSQLAIGFAQFNESSTIALNFDGAKMSEFLSSSDHDIGQHVYTSTTVTPNDTLIVLSPFVSSSVLYNDYHFAPPFGQCTFEQTLNIGEVSSHTVVKKQMVTNDIFAGKLVSILIHDGTQDVLYIHDIEKNSPISSFIVPIGYSIDDITMDVRNNITDVYFNIYFNERIHTTSPEQLQFGFNMTLQNSVSL